MSFKELKEFLDFCLNDIARRLRVKRKESS